MAPENGSANGWDEYGRHVLAELKRLSNGQEDMRDGQQAISIQLARIEGHSAWIAKIDERVTHNEGDIVKLDKKNTELSGEIKRRAGLISVLVSLVTAAGLKLFGVDMFGGH